MVKNISGELGLPFTDEFLLHFFKYQILKLHHFTFNFCDEQNENNVKVSKNIH